MKKWQTFDRSASGKMVADFNRSASGYYLLLLNKRIKLFSLCDHFFCSVRCNRLALICLIIVCLKMLILFLASNSVGHNARCHSQHICAELVAAFIFTHVFSCVCECEILNPVSRRKMGEAPDNPVPPCGMVTLLCAHQLIKGGVNRISRGGCRRVLLSFTG